MSDQSTTPKSAGHDTPRSGGGFTPGPWNAELGGELMPASERLILATLGYERGIRQVRTVARTFSNPGHAEALANARLIAAAPDLLEALKDVRLAYKLAHISLGFDPAGSASLQRADAAISKALGTSPEGLASMAMGGGDSSSRYQPSGARDLQPRCPQPQHFDGGEA